MKKYLLIVLLVGVCFGQAIPDTLTLQGGRQLLGTFIQKGEFFTEFYNWKENENSEIRNIRINRIVLSTGEVIYGREIPKGRIKSASEHFEMAGKHLQNSLIRNLYSFIFVIAGNHITFESIRDDKPTILSPMLYAAAIYNSIYATIEIYRCGDALIKASSKLKEIEESINLIEEINDEKISNY